MGKRKTHVRTKESMRKVRQLRGQGMMRKDIAAELGISLELLKEKYPMSLAQGDQLRFKARATQKNSVTGNDVGKVQTLVSRFQHTLKPPPNCLLTEEELRPYARQIAKFDANGIPCNARGNPVLGKRALADIEGRRAMVGTRWEVVQSHSPKYREISVADKPWNMSIGNDWEQRIMRSRSLLPVELPKSLELSGFWDEDDGGWAKAKDAIAGIKSSSFFNVELAQRALIAFNWLRLADAEGTPAMDEAGADWFREIVAVIFGSYDPKTKTRLVRELFLLVPKKNNKTTGGALIMLLLLIFNERPNGQAIMVAPVKDVASIAFDAIAGAIALDPVLEATFIVKPHKKMVIDRRTQAELSVMTFDPKQLTGQKVFAALIDELHVIASMSKADRAIRQIRGGMLPFPEAILIFITTQSEEAPVGVFKAELQKARDIRDGKIKNAKMLPILYEFPRYVQESPEQDWKNPKLWPKVTPNAGRSIALRDLETLFEEAQSKGLKELKLWASQHLNIEIGMALRSDSWVGADMYAKITPDPLVTLDYIIERSEVIEAGIDGGGLDDLLSLAIAGRERDTGRWLTWTHSWAHPILVERHKQEAARFKDFTDLGELTIVEDMGDDVDELVDIIKKCNKTGLLDKIGLDPHGVGSIVDALSEDEVGLDAQEQLLGISQGWRLSGAISTMERELATGRLVPSAQKIMAWAVSNAKTEPRGNAKLITKGASGSGKIDPLMAVLNAVHILSSNPDAKSKKYQMLVLGGGGSGSLVKGGKREAPTTRRH